MPNLPYIRAIGDYIPWHQLMLAPRKTLEDCKVDGYDIPKDMCVMVNIRTIGRDSQLSVNPKNFVPRDLLERI